MASSTVESTPKQHEQWPGGRSGLAGVTEMPVVRAHSRGPVCIPLQRLGRT